MVIPGSAIREAVRASAIGVALVLVVAGCDVGSVLLVENESDQPVIVRVSGNEFDSSAGNHPRSISAIVPANAKRAVVELSFTSQFSIDQVEVLADDCALLQAIGFRRDRGTLVVVHDDLSVEQRDEFPQSGDPGEVTDRCPGPIVSPAPS